MHGQSFIFTTISSLLTSGNDPWRLTCRLKWLPNNQPPSSIVCNDRSYRCVVLMMCRSPSSLDPSYPLLLLSHILQSVSLTACISSLLIINAGYWIWWAMAVSFCGPLGSLALAYPQWIWHIAAVMTLSLVELQRPVVKGGNFVSTFHSKFSSFRVRCYALNYFIWSPLLHSFRRIGLHAILCRRFWWSCNCKIHI